MKIYISADMEGCTGVTDVHQTMNGRPEYAFGCRMELHDVRAAAEGALEAGADEVLVNDAHGRKINVDIDGLGSRVRLLSGTPKPLGMMEGCSGSDGVFFIGYHAMAGTPVAVLDHTISGGTVYSIELNGVEMGELGLNAAVASSFGLPVALVEGDDALEREVRAQLGAAPVYARVKIAKGRLAADCLSPEDSYGYIKAKAKEAVERLKARQIPLFDIGDGSYDLRVTFHTTVQCDAATQIPALERLGGRTVRVRGRGMAEMRRWTGAIVGLASTANS
ncbi:MULTISPECIES: M55 family metallopeptidase [unclassified Pyramidobacter]|uniref:M55 family metallopeptidase n=1 Tax=unclassified Pyramidobacter TaxID=2632171 RepID=UPI000EA00E97|nr:M55 family metallopeptidase [Pyramidobacter sp. CG50-2]RKJ78997.1 aminopeptidase [Pyramidobacter sp. CG50-2]